MTKYSAIVVINNAISREMARLALARDGVPLSEVLLIVMRKLAPEPWFAECAHVVKYPAKASLTLWGQRKFARYYWQLSRLIRRTLATGAVRRAYLVNNDNLITNHLVNWCGRKQSSGQSIELTVLAEGIMNFQDIQARNRAWWRTWTKPALARLLGLRWKTPQGHLSAAFEPAVTRVVSFAATGLQAPVDKVVVLPFEPVAAQAPRHFDTLLYVETALWQWMQPAEFLPFADAFAAWLKSLGYARLLVKPHPNYPASDYLRSLLPPFELWGQDKSMEQLAAWIDADCVVGTCCTGLVTLQMQRPDLTCVDFGANYYLPKAYYGDLSVLRLLRSTGVTVQDMPGVPPLEDASAAAVATVSQTTSPLRTTSPQPQTVSR